MARAGRYARSMGMQVQITDPELQAKVEKWVADTGLPAEELLN